MATDASKLNPAELHFELVLKNVDKFSANNENYPSSSNNEQKKVESIVFNIFKSFKNVFYDEPGQPELYIEEHINFLKKGLHLLGHAYECLDASQTWLVFWIVHSLSLLKRPISEDIQEKIICFLEKCQSNEGGFGGGPYQIPHLAATYAAVNALCALSNFKAYELIDRENLLKFLFKMKQADGSFSVHEGGEVDIRSVYCAASIAKMTNIFHKDLFTMTPEWIINCQTYEGGFSCIPGTEAHGGYTFCGFAALLLIGQDKMCNIPNLLHWITNRQMSLEGGFNGRTNKLVDSCYSYWIGALFPMIFESQFRSSKDQNPPHLQEWLYDSVCLLLFSSHRTPLYDKGALQEYVLICCQSVTGSLLDKPDRPKDYYHTCYALAGLSIAQHTFDQAPFIVGNHDNELAYMHPVFNLEIEAERKAKSYFSKLFVPQRHSE